MRAESSGVVRVSLSSREDYYSNMVYIGHLTCIKADLTVLENIRCSAGYAFAIAPLDAEIEQRWTGWPGWI